jgi:protein SCO1
VKGIGAQLRVLAAAGLMALAAAATPSRAQDPRAMAQLRGVDIEERIGRTLPMELEFVDSDGRKVRLGDYFKAGNTRPAVIGLVYYRCPQVCDIFMAKMADTLREVDYTPGDQYQVLLFSFDHRETTALAAEAKDKYLKLYGRAETPSARAGWAFHTTDEDAAKQLAEAVGFAYRRMPDGNFSHPVCKFIITPDGKVSRYLYGYVQEPRDMKLAILEGAQGKLVATVGERLQAFCYVFDPNLGRYTLRAVRVMQVGGVLTLAGVATLLTVLFIGERVRRRAWRASRDSQDGSGEIHQGGTPATMG